MRTLEVDGNKYLIPDDSKVAGLCLVDDDCFGIVMLDDFLNSKECLYEFGRWIAKNCNKTLKELRGCFISRVEIDLDEEDQVTNPNRGGGD